MAPKDRAIETLQAALQDKGVDASREEIEEGLTQLQLLSHCNDPVVGMISIALRGLRKYFALPEEERPNCRFFIEIRPWTEKPS